MDNSMMSFAEQRCLEQIKEQSLDQLECSLKQMETLAEVEYYIVEQQKVCFPILIETFQMFLLTEIEFRTHV